MPWTCTPDFSDAGNDQGWTRRVWASADVFGQPVPLTVSRWRLDAGARAHGIPVGGTEAFGYVIAGSGTSEASPAGEAGEHFALAAESLLWLPACDTLAVTAGSDGLDLVTGDVPVGARTIRADRIIYHPGDTAAAHYHTDCHHVFCVLAGSGLLYTDDKANRLETGMSALVAPGETHWFENDRQEEFSFVEFWAPPPAQTIWTVEGDRCTWARAS